MNYICNNQKLNGCRNGFIMSDSVEEKYGDGCRSVQQGVVIRNKLGIKVLLQ